MRKQYATCIAVPAHVLSVDKRGIDGTPHKIPRERETTVRRNALFQDPLTWSDRRQQGEGLSFRQAFSLSTTGLSRCILQSFHHPCKLLIKLLCAGCITVIEKHHQCRPVTNITFQVHLVKAHKILALCLHNFGRSDAASCDLIRVLLPVSLA